MTRPTVVSSAKSAAVWSTGRSSGRSGRGAAELAFHLLLVALGGAIGTLARYGANLLALRLFGATVLWHTAAINIAGSFLMGVLIAVLTRRSGVAPEWRLFLATGVLGGFTTFSTFALDFAVLWQRNAVAEVLFYVLASVLGSILAIFAGLALARAFS